MTGRETGVRLRTLSALTCAVVLTAAFMGSCSGGVVVSVSGTVTAGPTCPAANEAAGPACTPQPLSGVHLTIVTASGGSRSGMVVAEPVTDQAGAFAVALRPGEYRIEGQGIPALVAPSPVFFDVAADGRPVEISPRYDTGIR